MTNEYLKNSLSLDIQADLKEKINLKILNYTKKKDTKANLSFNLTKMKNDLRLKKLNFSHDDTQILINGLLISNGNITSIDKLKVKTYLDGKNNNDFTLILKDKATLLGSLEGNIISKPLAVLLYLTEPEPNNSTLFILAPK